MLADTGNPKRKRSIGTKGFSAPMAKLRYENGHEFEVQYDFKTGEARTTIDHIAYEDPDGITRTVHLHPKMSSDQFRQKLEGITPKRGTRIRCSIGEETWERYTALASSLGWDLEDCSSAYTNQSHGLRITGIYNTHYFRAIAKIGFHYYLTRTSFLGTEPFFAAIRDFIWKGIGEPGTFFLNSPVFVNKHPNLAPARWTHTIAAFQSSKLVAAKVALLDGPQMPGDEYHLCIARPNLSIILPKKAWAHSFTYDLAYGGTRKCGDIHTGFLQPMN